jgi:hypothetical protein
MKHHGRDRDAGAVNGVEEPDPLGHHQRTGQHGEQHHAQRKLLRPEKSLPRAIPR